MSRTYDFAVNQALAAKPPPARFLDFGCGAGQIVEKAVAAGYDAHGADLFEGVWAQYRGAAGALGERLHLMPSPVRLPFADHDFDIAVSNQVFEHVPDKPAVIAELARVLKPGAALIAIFPTREMIFEPHLKAPLVHRFRNGRRAQAVALNLSHLVGLRSGAPPGRRAWVAHAAKSLAEDMFYLADRDVPAAFAAHFTLTGRAEAEFLRDRMAQSRRLSRVCALAAHPALRPLLRALTLRLANGVYIFSRR